MTREARLKALNAGVAECATLDGLAQQYDTTRGTISGALHRAGLSLAKPLSTLPKTVQRREAKHRRMGFNSERAPPREKRKPSNHLVAVPVEDKKEVKKLPAWEPLVGSRPRHLEHLDTATECCWPCWDSDNEPRIYCGEIREPSSRYCPTHALMAFDKLPLVRRKTGDAHEDRQAKLVPLAAAAE